MNNDLISREWLEDAFDNLCCHNCKTCRNFRIEDSFYKCALINNAPTIPLPDFKEGYRQAILDGKTNFSRPQGEWVGNAFDEHHCNRCEHPALWEEEPDGYYEVQSRFCPNCGAKMKGEEE